MTPPSREVCLDKVKVSHFIRKGIPITGVLHVGAHDGYEVGWYLGLGLRAMGIEPLAAARETFVAAHPDVPLLPYALSDYDGTAVLHVPQGSGQGASLLDTVVDDPAWPVVSHEPVQVWRWDTLVASGIVDPALYDCLVMDVEGMELAALRGFGELLNRFKGLSVECCREPFWVGQAPADEVISYLDAAGFRQDSPIEPHDDIMFVRKDVQP